MTKLTLNSFVRYFVCIIFLFNAGALITACGKKEVGKTIEKASNSDEKQVPQNTIAKSNAYVEAYNLLIDSSGVEELYKTYLDGNYTKIKTSGHVQPYRSLIKFSLTIDKLKAARQMPGEGIEAIDKSVDELLVAMNKLSGQLKPISAYLDSKAYLDDNFAKIKAEDATLLNSFKATILAKENFSIALEAEQNKGRLASLELLKQKGNMLAYSAKMALVQAENVASLFPNAESLSKTENYQKADAIALDLEKTLQQLGDQYEAAKVKNPAVNYEYESIRGNLTRFVGYYRSLKRSKDASDFNNMIGDLNRAIESSNKL